MLRGERELEDRKKQKEQGTIPRLKINALTKQKVSSKCKSDQPKRQEATTTSAVVSNTPLQGQAPLVADPITPEFFVTTKYTFLHVTG